MKFCLGLFSLLISFFINAQNLEYARKIVDTLASESMRGRGYVHNGDGKAADFIASEFRKWGLDSFKNSYYQKYSFMINTFPGNVFVKVNDMTLSPGVDFNIASYSGSVKGNFKLFYVSDKKIKRKSFVRKTLKKDLSGKVIVASAKIQGEVVEKKFNASGYLFLNDKLPAWSVYNNTDIQPFFAAEVVESAFPEKPESTEVDIESSYIKHKAANIAGYIPGIVKDTFLVVTAHYDHLGEMGRGVYFPGANDNASGVALMLDLARYYSANKDSLKYSVVFIAFSGEEAGLLGSSRFVEDPLFPLKQIKLLVNIDMVGTGSEGIAVVNSTAFPGLFNKLVALNEENKLLQAVNGRASSANSDHYPFYNKGVTSFFIYTLGKEHNGYHSLTDRADKLQFTAYDNLFKLLTLFFKIL